MNKVDLSLTLYMRIGIFFGGPSREREISFAGGRTVYDNLDKTLFEPVPIFVDSFRNLILLDWNFLYKGTIRDFYPPVDTLPDSPHEFQVYLESLQDIEDIDVLINKVGKKVEWNDLPQIMDLAFLALHGEFGEDGQIQGMLESLAIPYTGSGIRACSIGMDKAFQKKIMSLGGFPTPEVMVIHREEWLNDCDVKALYKEAVERIQYPLVIRPANQGSSIGVSIIGDEKGLQGFIEKIDAAFFIDTIYAKDWQVKTKEEKVEFIREITDIRSGLGFPMSDHLGNDYYHPESLLSGLDSILSTEESIKLHAHLLEQKVILEGFIKGREFSCIVIRQEDGTITALPPTEIIKGGEVFDYRSKYLPGLSRKVTPIGLPDLDIERIRTECERLFQYLEFNVYARIDGFINEEGTIFLNDPNTTSGMLPSSFFFHQAAEIGLNPSQFLTYLIRASLQERIQNALTQTQHSDLLNKLDGKINGLKTGKKQQKKIAIIMGGYSFERHISVESGRNIFEKLASSNTYDPIPVFLLGDATHFELYQIPINLMLKDNADDIRDKILQFKRHPIVEKIKKECSRLTDKYASSDMVFEPKALSVNELSELVDGVFIALHGRPGEDGTIQKELEKVGLPYNGSGPDSSGITINKFETLQLLKKHGFSVAKQYLSPRSSFENDANKELDKIEASFQYPFIAKPVDDGCSSAVKMIKNRTQMNAFFETIYRTEEDLPEEARKILQLGFKEEFPIKDVVLIEELISRNGATHFLEVTGGMLTHSKENGREYEIFEPSEALAGGEILSLEEKFLAGEGQNITPARFSKDKDEYQRIATQVKNTLLEAAKILNVKGYCRIDAFVRIFDDRKVETLIIEINSLPGMTPATCIFHQCGINGYKPFEFIDKILEFSFNERNQ